MVNTSKHQQRHLHRNDTVERRSALRRERPKRLSRGYYSMEHTCRRDSEENDDKDERQVAFLRARMVEATREGDTPEVNYLVGISSASRLLSAVDEVRDRRVTKQKTCSTGFLPRNVAYTLILFFDEKTYFLLRGCRKCC